MSNTEIEGLPSIEDIQPRDIAQQDAPEPVTVPAPIPNKARFQRKEAPKNFQFTGRATQIEAQIINEAIKARRKQKGIPEGETYDITRFALDCIKYIESDFFQTFKTK